MFYPRSSAFISGQFMLFREQGFSQ